MQRTKQAAHCPSPYALRPKQKKHIMKKLTLATAIFVLLAINVKTQPIPVNGEILADTNNLTVVKVWGTHYERGYAHGYLLGNKMLQTISYIKSYFGSDIDYARSLVSSGEDLIIEPQYQEEAQAMIAGMVEAGIDTTNFDYIDILVGNCWSDLEGYLYKKGGGSDCSCLLNWGEGTANSPLNGKSIAARFWDWSGYQTIIINNAVLIAHIPSEPDLQPWLLLGYAGEMVPSGGGISQGGLSMYKNGMSDFSGSAVPGTAYAPYIFTMRKILETNDFNGDGVHNTQDARDGFDANPQGYAIDKIIPVIARNNPDSDSLTAMVVEIAPVEPTHTYRTNSYDDNIPGDNLYAANHQIARNNAQNYCYRYNNVSNNFGDSTNIGIERNNEIMTNYSVLQSGRNYGYIQHIPQMDLLKVSVIRDGIDAYALPMTSFNLRSFFNRPPEFITEAILEIEVGIEYVYEIEVSDPDPYDSIFIDFEQIPEWLTLEDFGNGTAQLSGTPDQIGFYEVIIKAGDGLEELMQEFVIEVSDVASCLPDGITFTTQEQIDNFQTDYPGCTEIEGYVTIDGNNITNLNGLSVLTSIGGDLKFYYNDALISLAALANVTFIGGNLKVENSDALISLTGLDNLNSIGGDLVVEGNNALTSIAALANVTSIAGDLQIGSLYFGNPVLISLTGLEGLTTIGGSLAIGYNDALTSLTGLVNVTSIWGDLVVETNDALISLMGLDNITSVGGCLDFSGNDIITGLTGLENVISIGGNLQVSGNDALISLEGLDNLTSIGEYIYISGNDALTSLAGLDNLTSFGGDIYLNGNLALTSLRGLHNLTSIGGGLRIVSNNSLTSLMGLEGWTSIGGEIYLSSNLALNSLTGLENVTSIGEGLRVSGNDALTNLTGLDNLISIGGGLGIDGNNAFTSFTGLENLTSFGGGLLVSNNNALTSLTGLENLISIESLGIEDNSALTSLTGLENVTSIGESLHVYDNNALTGLTGLEGLASLGGDFFLLNNNTLTSLTGLDNLASIGGSLSIGYDSYYGGNPNLTSLSGLESLIYIGGSLMVQNNDALTSLTGLDNLASIGGNLWVQDNDSLVSLSGLENVTSIAGDLEIGWKEPWWGDCYGNPLLTSLEALQNLTSIGGLLSIACNESLTSLTGLDNVTPGSIENLTIEDNSALSNCAVVSICDYLAAPNGTIYFYNNAPGCNSPAEVEEACLYLGIGEEESNNPADFKIYPSPVGDFATLSFEGGEHWPAKVILYNSTGIKVKTWKFNITETRQNNFVLDLTALPSGMYCCRMQVGDVVMTRKMIKQ